MCHVVECFERKDNTFQITLIFFQNKNVFYDSMIDSDKQCQASER